MSPCSGPWANDSPDLLQPQSSPETRLVRFAKKRIIYSQGDLANCVFYILTGHIKLSVVTCKGEVGVVALLREGDYVGEGCVSHDQPFRTTSAVAVSDCSLIRIERNILIRRLQQEKGFSDLFLAYIIRRANEFQEHLVDHLFNRAEKRLARVLLCLAGMTSHNHSEATLPAINQETLAEMVGTTRSRVSFFMNKFRKLGFIKYNGELEVHSSLLNVVLHDSPDEKA